MLADTPYAEEAAALAEESRQSDYEFIADYEERNAPDEDDSGWTSSQIADLAEASKTAALNSISSAVATSGLTAVALAIIFTFVY